MLTTLQNDVLTLTVSDLGAEMQSLCGANGIDYLWNGDPEFWGGRAPNLFPIVGGLRGGRATSLNGPVAMPKHGLIRGALTTRIHTDGQSATYRYSSHEETLQAYPFPFVWEVTFTLQDNAVRVDYTVQNTGSTPMPYCIGGHPAFRVPLIEGEAFDDTLLEWEREETIDCAQLDMRHGTISSQGYNRLVTNKKCLQLSHVFFRTDALIMEHIRSSWLQLRGKSGHGVRLISEMPFWGVWSPRKDSPFVCLEPWTGMATRTDEDDVLEHKIGMKLLPAGEVGRHGFTIVTF